MLKDNGSAAGAGAGAAGVCANTVPDKAKVAATAMWMDFDFMGFSGELLVLKIAIQAGRDKHLTCHKYHKPSRHLEFTLGIREATLPR